MVAFFFCFVFVFKELVSYYAHVIGEKPVVSFVARSCKHEESEVQGTACDTAAAL